MDPCNAREVLVFKIGVRSFLESRIGPEIPLRITCSTKRLYEAKNVLKSANKKSVNYLSMKNYSSKTQRDGHVCNYGNRSELRVIYNVARRYYTACIIPYQFRYHSGNETGD